MTSKIFSTLLLASSSFLFAQGPNSLGVTPPSEVALKRGVPTPAKIKLKLPPGLHCNTNTPSDEYLIPLKLSFAPTNGLESTGVTYPKGKDETYSFSKKPLNVYSGEFELQASLKAGADAPVGPQVFNGKLRYQACNDTMCFAPKTIDVKIPVVVSN
ncbi:hypothetical protein F183_A35560 [Bryobacterales bacterium F-183]|nr:hypothetical protein F183_A35560 [Bryobacterales bacterium F-183]